MFSIKKSMNNNNSDIVFTQFTQADIFLNPEDQELAYRRRKDEEKTAIAWGTRKLLLTLVQFLTLFWDPSKVKNPVIVYAGAAPGISSGIASLLFPEVEFHMYDPMPFKVKATDKIHLYQSYFTDKTAKYWRKRQKKDKNVYFISDIRTADYTKAKNLDQNEEQIAEDMRRQMKWYQIIQPIKAQLKFRLPYTGGKRPETVNYLYGYIFKQAFAPQTSTETRLVPVENQMYEWTCMKYQSQLFYHNVNIRERYRYQNPFTRDYSNIDGEELTLDWDSSLECQIWMDYLFFRTGKIEYEAVKALSRFTTKKMNSGSKYKDTLEYLRKNPRAIKERNLKKRREDLDIVMVNEKADDDMLLLESLGIIF